MRFDEEYLTQLLDLGPEEIAKFCGDYLDGDTLTDHFERDEPFSRKECCQYLGIGESTMTGWLKEDRIPPMAKAAFMLPLIHRVLVDEIRRLRTEAKQPRILKNGDRYQIVAFEEDESGEVIGKVAADDISSLDTARILIAGVQALHLLDHTDDVAVQFAIDCSDPEDQPAFGERMLKLRKDIRMCLLYATDHEEWAKRATRFKEKEYHKTKAYQESEECQLARKQIMEDLAKGLGWDKKDHKKPEDAGADTASAGEEGQNEH